MFSYSYSEYFDYLTYLLQFSVLKKPNVINAISVFLLFYGIQVCEFRRIQLNVRQNIPSTTRLPTSSWRTVYQDDYSSAIIHDHP